jgi:hypothetical protein
MTNLVIVAVPTKIRNRYLVNKIQQIYWKKLSEMLTDVETALIKVTSLLRPVG